MSEKDRQRRSDEKPRVSPPSPGHAPASLFTDGKAIPEVLLAYRAELRRAWDYFQRDRFEEAEHDARRLLAALDRRVVWDTTPDPGAQVDAHLLRAAARVVLGYVQAQHGRPGPAREEFFAAADLYHRWLPKVLNPEGEDYRFYGLALYGLANGTRAPELEQALGALLRALERGDASADTFSHLGLIYLRRGDLRNAEHYTRKALDLNPNRPSLSATLAEILKAQGRQPEAPEPARRAGDVRALTAEGRALRLAGRLEESAAILRRAADLDAGFAGPHLELAETLLAQGSYEEALQAAGRALSLKGNPIPALAVKAQALRVLGRAEEALTPLHEILAYAPDPWAYAELGETLRLLGRPLEALEALDMALALRPENSTVLGTKGQVLRTLGRLDDAVGVLRRAIEIDPRIAWVNAELGEALRLQGRYEDALEALDLALELDPGYAFALGTKGQVLRALGQIENALDALRKAQELDPDLDWVPTELAEVLFFEEGRPGDALQTLKTVLERRPRDPYVLTLTGRALGALGRFAEAADFLRRALELDPDKPLVHTGFAELQRLQGHNEEALRALDRALEIDPSYAPALRAKGQLLWLQKRYGEALEILDRALKVQPGSAFALAIKGQVLRSLGRIEEGVLAIHQALEWNPRLGFAYLDLSSILCDMDYPDEALDVVEDLDSALVHGLEPIRLGTQGQALIAMGRYAEAERLLVRAHQIDPSIGWLPGIRGWALENLGRPQEALAAYQAASEREPGSWWWQKGVANALLLTGNREKALTKYQALVEQIEKAPKFQDLEAETVSLLGWCYYRLGYFDKAIRHIVQALTLNHRLVSDQFDLALVLYEMGQKGPSLREYEKGLEMARLKPVSRRCGLFRVALRDLENALAAKKGSEAPAKPPAALSLLKDALEEVTTLMEVAAPFRGRVRNAVAINAPANVVYHYLIQFENFPRLLTGVRQVSWDAEKGLLTWHTRVASGEEREWQARIVEQVPYSRLACQSTSSQGYCYSMTLFAHGAATHLMARLAYNPATVPGDAAAVRDRMAQGLEEGLNRFKAFVESSSLGTRAISPRAIGVS